MLSFLFIFKVVAQNGNCFNDIFVTVPEIFVVDIEPNSSSFNLAFTAPTVAGNPVTNPTPNTTKWINYSALKKPISPSYYIVARISSGSAPAGVALYIQAGNHVGSSSGVVGSSTGLKTLTTSNQTIINGIGTGSTGNGINNGHLLTFSAAITDYSLIKFTEGTPPSIAIQFTIMN
jgi:hypothetical protein